MGNNELKSANVNIVVTVREIKTIDVAWQCPNRNPLHQFIQLRVG